VRHGHDLEKGQTYGYRSTAFKGRVEVIISSIFSMKLSRLSVCSSVKRSESLSTSHSNMTASSVDFAWGNAANSQSVGLMIANLKEMIGACPLEEGVPCDPLITVSTYRMSV
jgi:hypothetical protein